MNRPWPLALALKPCVPSWSFFPIEILSAFFPFMRLLRDTIFFVDFWMQSINSFMDYGLQNVHKLYIDVFLRYLGYPATHDVLCVPKTEVVMFRWQLECKPNSRASWMTSLSVAESSTNIYTPFRPAERQSVRAPFSCCCWFLCRTALFVWICSLLLRVSALFISKLLRTSAPFAQKYSGFPTDFSKESLDREIDIFHHLSRFGFLTVLQFIMAILFYF